MTRTSTLEVRTDDLSQTRLSEQDAPALKEGEILTKIDRFALTANNITYGVVGEKFGYWKFFPVAEPQATRRPLLGSRAMHGEPEGSRVPMGAVERSRLPHSTGLNVGAGKRDTLEGWGVIPVWGFAEVIESKHPEVKVGERLYGYFPMGTHLAMAPDKVTPERLFDGAPHRAGLPPVYNVYTRTAGEPHYDPGMDDERMLLLPLYATSFCLYDFLSDKQWFGARQVVILSASSKTAIGLAMAIASDPSPPDTIALTSPGNLAMVKQLGLYSVFYSYDELKSIDATLPAVIVDMSGDGKLLSALHAHLGDNMRYCANVGVTHYEEKEMGPHFIVERSATFFAPGHIQKRRADWGPGVLEKKMFLFWHEAAQRSREWLKFDRVTGIAELESAYRCVLSGESAPDRGVVVKL